MFAGFIQSDSIWRKCAYVSADAYFMGVKIGQKKEKISGEKLEKPGFYPNVRPICCSLQNPNNVNLNEGFPKGYISI